MWSKLKELSEVDLGDDFQVHTFVIALFGSKSGDKCAKKG